MNRRIIGVLTCMLLMVNSLAIVSCADFKQVPTEANTNSFDDEVNVPTWNIGDSWTYDVEHSVGFDQYVFFDWILEDLEFTVTDDAGDSYRVEFAGDVVGEIGHFPFAIPLEDATIQGHEIIGKSDLGISQLIAHAQGTRKIGPVEIPIDIDITVTSDPAFTVLSFPLFVGKSWTRPSSSVSIEYTISMFGETETIQKYLSIPEMPMFCTGIETTTVEAGTYEAFKISGGSLLDIYYAPTVANIIKISGSDPSETRELNMELISTTYTSSGSPGKPIQPSGPSSGDSGVTYTYCTSTTDPDGDRVYYWFDWGDGTNSGWLGPFNSGETTCADHLWTENGTYEIKAKAKDVNDTESPWSDPLVVAIGEIEDDEDPYVEIIKPEQNGVYYNNNKVGSIPFTTVIMGHLDIKADASDSKSGINRVEFYIDGSLKETDTSEPYICSFDESSGTHAITAIAYDNAGNSASDDIVVWKLF